jgi:hypothetical protein
MGGERGRLLIRPADLLRPLLIYLLVVIILAVAFSIACGSNGDSDPSATSTEEPLPADASAIRSVDLVQAPATQTMLRQLGGGNVSIDTRTILYADVTGDRREEAFLPVDSGGTLGNVAYIGFALRSGSPVLILTRTIQGVSGLVMQVEDGKLVETQGEYGLEDAFCCPSKLRKVTFRWDGNQLQVEREEVIANPAGGPKQ